MSKSVIYNARRIARNTFLNAGTRVFLILLGLIFIPLMIRSFGMEIYGVLTITWMVLGQLGWLNAGLGRASTKYVAHDLATGQEDQAGLWTWTAVVAQTILGLSGAMLLWLLSPQLVSVLNVQPQNRDLVMFTIRAFGLVIPFDLASSSIRGVLEATQKFGAINAINILEAFWTYSVYGIAIWQGGDLRIVVYGLIAFKLANIGILYAFAARALPSLRSFSHLARLAKDYRARVLELLRFGGWVTVSAGIGPLLLYFDRWLISSILGAATLPLYSVPFNLLSRLSFLPTSLTGTLFPAFSSMQARGEWDRVDDYFVSSHRYLLLLLAPLLFLLFIWAHELLRLWIGLEFAIKATPPLRILILGFSVALLAPLSGTLLEGGGRPDRLSKLYLFELPFNLMLVWILVQNFGIVGAAWSFTFRAAFETVSLWIILYRTFPLSKAKLLRQGLYPFAILAAAILMAAYFLRDASISSWPDIGITLGALVVYALVTTGIVLNERDRHFLHSLISREKNA